MQRRLLFVSARFLFPRDSGGKIRTTQILRGMKGGAFHITLVSPVPAGGIQPFKADLDSVSDNFLGWPETERDPLFFLKRMRHLFSELPISIATDRSAQGRSIVRAELQSQPDVVVFDFPHSVVLAPEKIKPPSVMFTHNVELEIFKRHADVASNSLLQAIWNNQLRKITAFEKKTLRRFDCVVAVSERDGTYFRNEFGIENVSNIPTGVDLEFLEYTPPGEEPRVVYVGSMDSMANIDGIDYFMDEIWPGIIAEVPDASMTVIGKNPPAWLVKKARARNSNWSFTGFVDDIRPHASGAAAYVVPLRVGGGTRIKVYEALALGGAMVSTSIGVEGLSLQPGQHYLQANEPDEFSREVIRILRDKPLRERLSRDARGYVENNFGADVAAKKFEEICLKTAESS